MRRKGQSALEAAFVVLFMAAVIAVIFSKTTTTSSNIGYMAETRAAAQGASLELTLMGTLTHLIRVDREVGEDGSPGATIYIMSSDCGTAEDFFLDEKFDPSEVDVDCLYKLYLDDPLCSEDKPCAQNWECDDGECVCTPEACGPLGMECDSESGRCK